MGTDVHGNGPFSPSDVDPTRFGSGGRSYAPNQGYTAAPAVLHQILQRLGYAVANTTALQATVQADRADGMLVVTLDTYTLWVWENASTATPSASVIEPTDTAAGSGNGRWVAMAEAGSGGAAGIQESSVALTQANVAAKGAVLSGTFTAAALPVGARFLGAVVDIATEFSGTSTLTAKLGDGTTADKYMGATSLEQVAGEYTTAGSATFNAQNIGGVTPTVTVTATGSDLNTVAAGAATVKLFYFVEA